MTCEWTTDRPYPQISAQGEPLRRRLLVRFVPPATVVAGAVFAVEEKLTRLVERASRVVGGDAFVVLERGLHHPVGRRLGFPLAQHGGVLVIRVVRAVVASHLLARGVDILLPVVAVGPVFVLFPRGAGSQSP